MIVPLRLASSASSTIPPMSALTPASSAESVKRVLPRLTVIGCSSGFWSSRRTTRVASAVRMPPTSTPAIATPWAIRSSRDESYANAATAPPPRTSRRTATRMNHRCLMGGIPAQGTVGSGDRRRLGAALRRMPSRRTRHRPMLAPLHGRSAPGEHRLDRADHPRPIGVIALIGTERLEVVELERGEQGDHLLGSEMLVVLHRPPRAPALAGALLGLADALLRPRGALRGGPGRLLRGRRAALGLGGAVRHVVRQVHAGRVSEARQETLQLGELIAAQRRDGRLARVLHVRAPAEEVLHLALVAVRLLRAPHDRVQPQVLAQLLDGLAARVLVVEAGRLVAPVVHPAAEAHLL